MSPGREVTCAVSRYWYQAMFHYW